MKIQIRKTKLIRQKFHSVIVADNGQVLYTSENYRNLSDCLHTASLMNLPVERFKT